MGVKFISIGIALLMFIMPLSITSAQSVEEVESGLGGITDLGTNIYNVLSFVGYAFGSFDFSMNWIRGMMNFIRNYPDSAGQMAGLYLSTISFFLPVVAIPLWIIPILGLVLYFVIILVGGVLGVLGGYFVFANSGGLLYTAGIVQMAGGALSLIPLIGSLTILVSMVLQIFCHLTDRGAAAEGAPETVPGEVPETVPGEKVLEEEAPEGKKLPLIKREISRREMIIIAVIVLIVMALIGVIAASRKKHKPLEEEKAEEEKTEEEKAEEDAGKFPEPEKIEPIEEEPEKKDVGKIEEPQKTEEAEEMPEETERDTEEKP